MADTMKARLASVQSESPCEYSDLVGCEGELHLPGLSSPHNWFLANGDMLSLLPSHIVWVDGGLNVHTTLGNTFTFVLLA